MHRQKRVISFPISLGTLKSLQAWKLKNIYWITKALKAYNPNIPVILFCRGSSVFASQLAEINPAAISLDWNCDITAMRKTVSAKVALQGNLDPDVLFAPKEIIQKEVRRILKGMHGDPGFIFNLGHGILPDVPVESVRTLVETVKSF